MAAPLTELNDFIEVNMVGKYHAQVCITTHLYQYWTQSQGGMELTLQQVAEAFLSKFWTAQPPRYRDKMSSFYTLTAITAQVIHPVRSIMWPAVPQAADAAGSVIGASLPSGVCAVIRRRGNLGDRHNYGRIYLPALSVTYVSDSQLTQLGKDALAPVATAQSDDVSVAGTGGNATLRPFILRKGDVANSRVVTHGLVDSVVRYQRRREVGVGI